MTSNPQFYTTRNPQFYNLQPAASQPATHNLATELVGVKKVLKLQKGWVKKSLNTQKKG